MAIAFAAVASVAAIGADQRVRYHHFGDGNDEHSKRLIQQLQQGSRPAFQVDAVAAEAAAVLPIGRDIVLTIM
jgi:hypothetical protein